MLEKHILIKEINLGRHANKYNSLKYTTLREGNFLSQHFKMKKYNSKM